MFTKTLSKLFIVVVIVTVALLTVSFVASPKDSQSYQDYAQRHPGGVVLSAAVSSADNQGSDYYQRHRSELMAARSLDTTEYFFRHPELSTSMTKSIDLTDYFFRHLELSNK